MADLAVGLIDQDQRIGICSDIERAGGGSNIVRQRHSSVGA
jgi:hypothetical protein